MTKRPLILVSPGIEKRGVEFHDQSISLSEAYLDALLDGGALPLVMPTVQSQPLVAECVRRADGVVLTGGEDIHPRLYANKLPARLQRTVVLTPDSGERDRRELLLIAEVFRQRKPLLAVCRGHQILNVAMGGTLLTDIHSQRPHALNHRRQDRKSDVVHDVRLTADSMLARLTRRNSLGVNSTHHQAVDRIADVLRATATSADGIIESMELKPTGKPLLPFLLSVQFHPERLVNRYAEHRMIFRAFVRACSRPGDR
jgi:putative glutamine amidotransferase